MRVVGTAGHVDHGKSSLVRRLTGINPDRLIEEQVRQMTIDLGFAWLTLPDGSEVSLIDVPGHRDFIENMLAGAGGVDAALLVIAADEGVMPQTREHLAILDLLEVRQGIVVLTKADAVDAEWLDLMAQDVRAFLHGTRFATAPLLPVSAHTGAGIADLLVALSALLRDLPERRDEGRPRLPIDRVFTLTGFGTVVTGTLSGGTLQVGDEVEFQPGGLRGRIRGLQRHKRAVDALPPGTRAAVNVAGVEWTSVRRGLVLTQPGMLAATTLVDVHVRHLADAEYPLKHNMMARFFSGTSDTNVRIRLLGAETLLPGEVGWLQLQLDRPLGLTQGDHFILRSTTHTIAGGVIVDAHPPRRWRRFRPDVIDALETRQQGTPLERVVEASNTPVPVTRDVLRIAARLNDEELDSILQQALRDGLLVKIAAGYWSVPRLNAALRRLVETLTIYHQSEPLRVGMPREALRSKTGFSRLLFDALLMRGEAETSGDMVRLASHRVQFTTTQQTRIQQLMAQMGSFSPPSTAEASALVGEEVLRALIELGEVRQVQPDVIFSAEVYETLCAGVFDMIDRDGKVTAKALRDRFNTSRKYVIALLEYLDDQGLTRRVGDVRVRGRIK